MKNYRRHIFTAIAVILLTWMTVETWRARTAIVSNVALVQANKQWEDENNKLREQKQKISRAYNELLIDREKLIKERTKLNENIKRLGKRHPERKGCDCRNTIADDSWLLE